MLVDRAKVQPHETVLVLGAGSGVGSGVGSAAIQIASLIGAKMKDFIAVTKLAAEGKKGRALVKSCWCLSSRQQAAGSTIYLSE